MIKCVRDKIKLLSVLLLTFSIIMSAIMPSLKFSLSAETAEKTLLFSCDYEKADKKVELWEYETSSRDMLPMADPLDSNNTVMRYSTRCYDEGALFFGTDYSKKDNDKIKEAALKPNAGKTYEVEFDLYITGKVIESEPSLRLFLCVGKSGSDGKISYDANNAVRIANYSSGTVFNQQGWQKSKKASITLKDSFKSDEYPYLMLYAAYGGREAAVYIDNVKLYECPPKDENILFECDYQGAETNVENWDYATSSRDVLPKADPLDSTNTAMRYSTRCYDEGALFLGSDYSAKDNDKIKKAAIKPEAGKTYEVEYDFYVKGRVLENEPSLRLYLCAAKSGSDGKISYDADSASKIAVYDSGTELNQQEWQRGKKTKISLPDNFDSAEYPYLVIYAAYGGREAEVYFDNVKVVEKETKDDSDSFECDYQNAETNVNDWDYPTSSRDMLPKTDPLDSTNIAMRYSTRCYDEGALFLGSDYSLKDNDAIKNAAIKPEAGKTYNVTYDFYATGKVLETEPALKVYLCAAKSGKDGKISFDSDNAVQIARYEQGSSFIMKDWERGKTVSLTLPAGFDSGEYPYLIIYASYGGREASIYFDNIKVKKSAQQYETKYDNGYDNATVQDGTDQSIFKDISGDIYPSTDPLKSGNKVMKYAQNRYDRSLLFLGSGYKDAKAVGIEAIKVKAGETYTVTFDYYVEDSNKRNTDLNIGVGVGSTDTSIKIGKVSSYRKLITLKSGNNADTKKWKRDNEFTYTVPVGSTLENGKTLFIYAEYGNGATVYFDNVRVKKSDDVLKPGGDGVYKIKFDTNGGDPLPDMNFNLVTGNNVIRYKPSYYGAGQLILGADYTGESESIAKQGITAEKGATYDIEFDYYINGPTDSNTATIAVGIGGATANDTDKPKYSAYKPFMTFPANSLVSEDKWQRNYKVSYTVPTDINFANGDKLMLCFQYGQTSSFIACIDNVRVCKNGQEIFKCDYNKSTVRADSSWLLKSSGDVYPVTDPLGGVKQLPTPTHKKGVFVGWYVDPELLNPVNEDSFYKCDYLTLYAKWNFYDNDVLINVDDTTEYWTPGGKRESQRLDNPITIENYGGNKVLKYKMSYADKTSSTIGDCKSETGAWDGWVIGLFDPNVFKKNPNAKPDEAAYLVKKGGTYYISFKYKALSVDSDSNCITRMSFGIGLTQEDSTYVGKKKFANLSAYSATPDSDWKTAGGFFTVDDLKESGNRLAIMCYGFGEMLIDDIHIISVDNGYVFDTDGGTTVRPVSGEAGERYTMPGIPSRENSKFIGWYTDPEYKKAFVSNGKIPEGTVTLYAKFLTYQTVQSFENYSRGKGDSFEFGFWVNRHTNDTAFTENKNWLGSKFVKDGVRNGKASIVNDGKDEYAMRAILFDANAPLTIGEEYTISVWVKMEEYLLPADICLVFTDSMDELRSAEWSASDKGGKQVEKLITTKPISGHMNEWVEIRYDFIARAKYCGIETPGLTKMYVDDACITLKSADSSYERSIAGPGIPYDELIKVAGSDIKQTVKQKKIIIKPASVQSEDSGMGVIKWVIIGVSVLVVGAAATIAIVILKKKKIIFKAK